MSRHANLSKLPLLVLVFTATASTQLPQSRRL